MKKEEHNPIQHNALLTFTGEQDAYFFATALIAVSDKSADDFGGSREISVRAEGNNIVIGYKKNITV